MLAIEGKRKKEERKLGLMVGNVNVRKKNRVNGGSTEKKCKKDVGSCEGKNN